MGTDGNGTTVTWRELNLLRQAIDARFDTLASDVAEIKWSMNLVLENKKQRLRAWGPPLIAALIAVAVSVPVALFAH